MLCNRFFVRYILGLIWLGLQIIPTRADYNISKTCSASQSKYCVLSYPENSSKYSLLVFGTETLTELNEIVLNNVGMASPHFAILMEHAPNLQKILMHKIDWRYYNNDANDGLNENLLSYVSQLNHHFNMRADVFRGLKNLEELSLARSIVLIFDDHTFSELSKLKTLNLQNTYLPSVDDKQFYNLTNLEWLDLSHNSLTQIKKDLFAGNSNLKTLLLNNNNISIFHKDALIHIPQLHILDVSNNKFPELYVQTVDRILAKNGELSRCVINGGVVFLDASDNELKEIEIQDKTTVQELRLQNNHFDTLDAFQGMINLRYLDLSQNLVKTLTTSYSPLYLPLPGLTYLNLSGNKLKNLTTEIFFMLQKLNYLDLSFNHFRTLDASIFESLSNLKELYIEGNMLKTFNFELCAAQTQLKSIGLYNNYWSNHFLLKMLNYLALRRIETPQRFTSSEAHFEHTMATEPNMTEPAYVHYTDHMIKPTDVRQSNLAPGYENQQHYLLTVVCFGLVSIVLILILAQRLKWKIIWAKICVCNKKRDVPVRSLSFQNLSHNMSSMEI